MCMFVCARDCVRPCIFILRVCINYIIEFYSLSVSKFVLFT
jgi:hypothetical protein